MPLDTGNFVQIALIVVVALFVLGIPLVFIASVVFLVRSRNKGWLFLVIPSGLLSAILALGAIVVALRIFSGAAEIVNTLSPKALPPDGVVVSRDELLRTRLPKHWSILENLNASATLQAGDPVREEYMLVLTEPKDAVPGGIESYANLMVNHLIGTLQDVSVEGPEEVTINGMRGYQYAISGSAQGMRLEYLFTILEGPEAFHQVAMWTLQKYKDQAFAVFRETIQTVEPMKKN